MGTHWQSAAFTAPVRKASVFLTQLGWGEFHLLRPSKGPYWILLWLRVPIEGVCRPELCPGPDQCPCSSVWNSGTHHHPHLGKWATLGLSWTQHSFSRTWYLLSLLIGLCSQWPPSLPSAAHQMCLTPILNNRGDLGALLGT